MKELIKNFLIYGIGSTLGKFISFFMLPIYARMFTPEDYGVIDLLLTIVVIASTFSMFQIETSMQRFYYEKEDKSKTILVSTAFWFTFICSLFVILIVVLFVPLICHYFFSDKYQLELILSLISLLFSNLATLLFIILRYNNKAKEFTYLSVIQVFFIAGLTILCVVYLQLGILGVVLSNLIGMVLIFICLLYICRKDIVMIFSKALLSEMLKFGLPQFPARIGSVVNSHANRFFLVGYLSVSALGLYAVSLKIASGMQLIQVAFQMAWLPFLYKILKEDNHKEQIIRVYRLALLLISFIVCVASLISKEVIMLLTPDEYLDSYVTIGALTFYFALFILKDTVEIGTQVTKKTSYISYIYLISSFVNIGFLILLISDFGIKGVVIALLLSNFVLFFLTLLNSVKLYPMNFPLKFTIGIFSFTLLLVIQNMYLHLSLSFRLIILSIIAITTFFIIYRTYSVFLNDLFKSYMKKNMLN